MGVKIEGIITPILTPMFDDESINEKELRNQVDRLIDAGVSGIFCFGTNGESYILSDAEKEFVLKVVIEQTAHRVPVYAGTGCPGTKDTIRMSQMAEKLGADVLSIICPYFAAANQHEIYNHYKTVNDNVDLPIVIYNIPPRTGNKVLPETIKKLSVLNNIQGVKDSSGDFQNMLKYLDATEDLPDFSVLAGNDALILPNLFFGGKGAIAGCSNIYPKQIVSIYNLFREGKIEEAKKAQKSINPLRATFRYGNPNTIIKTAVRLLGYPVGPCRAPFNEISPEGLEELKKVLEENRKVGME